MVGDEVQDPPLRAAVVRRLFVQRRLDPSRPRKLDQWPRQEGARSVLDDLPVNSVVVVAVSSEERRHEVENALALYYQWRVQRLADRRLGVAREVFPRPVEERATQLPVRLGAFEWITGGIASVNEVGRAASNNCPPCMATLICC